MKQDESRVHMSQARRHYQLLSGTIYHLKNTMAVVSEYMELLDIEGELNDSQRDYIARSRRSMSTAMRLLSELHELGRADAGEIVARIEPLDICSLVRDVIRDFRLSDATTGVRFVFDNAGVPPLQTDPDCVRQILENLVSNAVRYSPAEGTVQVTASVRSGRRADDPARWVCVDVVDAGPGVTEKEAVFEEVSRVARKGSPGFRLAISRRLAKLLGGDLTLTSRPGHGAHFSLWLPFDEEVPLPADFTAS